MTVAARRLGDASPCLRPPNLLAPHLEQHGNQGPRSRFRLHDIHGFGLFHLKMTGFEVSCGAPSWRRFVLRPPNLLAPHLEQHGNQSPRSRFRLHDIHAHVPRARQPVGCRRQRTAVRLDEHRGAGCQLRRHGADRAARKLPRRPQGALKPLRSLRVAAAHRQHTPKP